MVTTQLATLFWARTEQAIGCWPWRGHLDERGYGRLRFQGKVIKAYRLSYELHKGEIPDGLVIDHLCRNHACVNPDHLEAVTPRENTLRGMAPAARHARATHCPQGHPYDEANTYVHPKGWRSCRACRQEDAARRLAERNADDIAAARARLKAWYAALTPEQRATRNARRNERRRVRRAERRPS